MVGLAGAPVLTVTDCTVQLVSLASLVFPGLTAFFNFPRTVFYSLTAKKIEPL